jgi:hypothetical protein
MTRGVTADRRAMRGPPSVLNPKVSADSAVLGTQPGSGGIDPGTRRVLNRVVRPAYLGGPALLRGQVRDRLTIVSVTVGAGP